MATLGDNIKTELKRQNMTQKELCEKTGIKESVMSRYVNENESVRTDVLLRIAEALNVDMYQLLGIANTHTSAYETCKTALSARNGNKLTEEEMKELIYLILEN